MVSSSRRDDTRVVADLRVGTDAGEAALEQVYRRHGGAVLSFVSYCTGDVLVAQQVVEEVFVHLWRQPQSFDPSGGSLRSHLVKDGHWRCEGLVCLDQYQDRSVLPDQGERDGRAATPPGLPAGWQALPLEERAAIGFVRFGQMTITEIAECLGVDERTVHARLTRGLQRLAAGGAAS